MKKISVFAAVAGVLLLLYYLKPEKSIAKKSNTQGVVKPSVKAVVIKPKGLDNKLSITGTVIPNEEIELQSEVSGKITRINFKEGDRVNAGDVLVRINDAELKAQLDKAQLNKKLREDREFRQRKLYEKEAISKAEYDIALTELNTSNAEIEILQAQLDKTIIKAPFTGKIGLRYVSEGSFINSSSKIASLTSYVPAKIDFSIPAKYSGQVKAGNIIRFTAEGSDKTYEGKVYAIEPKINTATRTLQLRALSPNEKEELLPGFFVRIQLIIDRAENAYLVPTEAVIPELNGHKVFAIKNGKVESRKVTVGIRTDTEIEITEGVSSNDTIINSGIMTIKPGDEVQITELK